MSNYQVNSMNGVIEIFKECESIVLDKNYTRAIKWKSNKPQRVLIGIIPNYIPREIIHSANGFAVGILNNDLYNYINQNGISNTDSKDSCNIFSGLFELVKSKAFEIFDGFILPKQCQVINDFKELNEIEKKCKFVRYINFPQYFHTIISDIMNRYIVQDVLNEIYKINGITVTKDMIENSIELYRINMKLTEKLFLIRQKFPEKITEKELYTTVLAGLLIPIEEHNSLLNKLNELLLEEVKLNIGDFFEVPSGPYC
jgi:benzoyl-CoA reductase subunit C